MRIHWWQSIRWRLALGSMLVALMATALLALTSLVAIVYYYTIDQRDQLAQIAADRAQRIGADYNPGVGGLVKAVYTVLPSNRLMQDSQSEQYLLVVFNRAGSVIYPRVTQRTGVVVKPGTVAAYLLNLANPSLQKDDYSRIHQAIQAGMKGTTTIGQLNDNSLISPPFVAQPIFDGGQDGGTVLGVIMVVPRSAAENTVSPFIMAVGQSVLVASLVVATLAILAAILFSRTITRPLAKLTVAARDMVSGRYSTRVATKANGELGVLANTFNDMATRLEKDVSELQRQELWRRDVIMNLTHDLATPLTAIAGLGESLVDGVNQGREDYEATGRIIVRETLRLRRLVKDLHMMARVEAGALQPQRKPVRLAALVDEVMAVLVTEFERADVEPRNAIPYDLPPVMADPDMLTRVFSNLCDNALRHTPPGGVVVVEAIQQGNRVIAAITDTGEGIPPEAVQRVFERFYRADGARQTMKGGSGLGLAIVRAIVEAHGGVIGAENVPGAGARILFTLSLS
jgi:signal transduction histidine kinase